METHEYQLMYSVEKELWWYRALREVLQYFFQKYLSSGVRILDAGCGTGMNTVFLQKLGYRLDSFDLSPNAVRYSRQRGVKRARVGSVTKIAQPAKKYDAACTLDVLMMLPPREVKKAVSELYRVLKPGGVLIVQVPALEWLRSQHDVVCHVRKRYTRTELEALFPSRKWTVRHSTYRIWLLFPLVATIKIVKKIVGEEKTATGDLWVPPQILNEALFSLQRIENYLLRWISFPWGSSVFIVVQKLGQ